MADEQKKADEVKKPAGPKFELLPPPLVEQEQTGEKGE